MENVQFLYYSDVWKIKWHHGSGRLSMLLQGKAVGNTSSYGLHTHTHTTAAVAHHILFHYLAFNSLQLNIRAEQKQKQEIGLDGKLVSKQSGNKFYCRQRNDSNFTKRWRREAWCCSFSYHLHENICFTSPTAMRSISKQVYISSPLFTLKQQRYDFFPTPLSVILSFTDMFAVHPLSMLPDSGYALISNSYLQKAICHASLLGLPKIASR